MLQDVGARAYHTSEMRCRALAGADLNRPLDLDLGHLSDLAPRVPFTAGMVLGVQDEPCTHLHILTEGQVILSRKSPGGETTVLSLLAAGDLFGEGSLLPSKTWLVTARAHTDGAAHLFSGAMLPRFAQHYPRLAAHVITLLSSRLALAHRRLDIIRTSSAREKVLGVLALLADRHGFEEDGRYWIPVKMTQSDMGDMVGLARETVARCLAELRSEGVFAQERQGIWFKPPRK